MLSPRWVKVARDLWRNKSRTVLVVLSIAVGVFAVGMIASSQMILASDLPTSYTETHPAHAILHGRFEDETVAMVARMAGVAAAEGRGGVSTRLHVGPDELRALNLTTIPDFRDIRVSQISPVQGAWPPDDRTFLIEQASLAALPDLRVGDSVTVEVADGKQRTLTIAGVVHDLGQPSALFNPTLNGFITRDTQEWLGNGRDWSELHLLMRENVTDRELLRAAADEIAEKLEKGGLTIGWIQVPRPGEHWADDVIAPLMTILGALGLLSLLLSGFLVVNTISALLAQQVRQIGVMKTIGARTGQLIRMYLVSVLIFGSLSLLVAVPLGAWAAHGLVNFTAGMLNFYRIDFRIPPQALALEVGVGLMVPVLAALWPVLTGARLTVQQALSSYGMGKGHFGNSPLDRLLERITGLPRPILLSLRNTFRRKGRLLLTLSTLTLGGAIFIAVLSVHASLMATLDDALAYWNYDIDLSFTRPYRTDVIVAEALRVPGVVAAESWTGRSARRVRADDSESPNIFLLAPPAATEMIRPRLLEGRWLLPHDENAVVLNSTMLDEDPDIRVGDEIVLAVEGRELSWRVVGIVQGVMTGPIAYANAPYFTREIGFVGRAGSVQIVTAQHDAASQLAVAAALTEHFERLGMNVAATEATSATREQVTNQFNILVVFLSIMALLIAIVGALGLMGTMSINVLERSREIGVMRAIGASDSSVLHIFLVEGLLIGLLSWGVGGVLAVPISKLLSNVVGLSMLDAPLSYTFSLQGAVLWLGLVLLLAALSSWWPSWRASRLTVRDVLAYE